MIEGKEIIKDEVANAASRNDELESREKKYEVSFDFDDFDYSDSDEFDGLNED